MKKITGIIAIAAALFATQSQAQFFEQTDYVGALSSDATKDWTVGWTNWTPKSTNYTAANETSTLDASATGKKEITTTVTLDNTKVYLLKGFIVIKSGGKLIIPAGTLIRCDGDLTVTPKNYASIIVERGGMIDVPGTSTNPVVFTSNKAAGSRERGDWGGIVICGKAVNNQGADVQVEGFNNVTFDNTLAKFGGTDNADNSGSIKYCRIEFGGLAFEANKEINGLTLGSVGSATTIDGVQVSYSNDDSYEWFGGQVNCKRLIAFKGTDDDFDTDFGFNGHVQYGLGLRDPRYSDQCTCSSSEGFESDNDGTGTDANPRTSPYFYNMTMVGPLRAATTAVNSKYQRALRIRRNSQLSSFNSIYMEWPKGLLLDGDKTAQRAKDGQLKFQGNIIAGIIICCWR